MQDSVECGFDHMTVVYDSNGDMLMVAIDNFFKDFGIRGASGQV
jgi:hypothetical protein